MSEYEVMWSIPVEADGPIDAALQVKGTLQDPGNEAWVFVVTNDRGETLIVDAQYTDQPIAYRPPGNEENQNA